MSFFKKLSAEISLNKSITSKVFLFFFRTGQLYFSNGNIIGLPSLFVLKGLKLLCGLDISPKTSIGWGLCIFHPRNIVINGDVIVGGNCVLRHNCTIGNKSDKGLGASSTPVIGNGVIFGAGVIVIGDIKIGDDVILGAGAVVTRSVPARAVVAGNPARIIREDHEAD
ncbi:serine acetyltransferase [Aeromonas veronii]|uniref:serine acetyltransferase n=1 Tax=Aeromonas veronii TaxID=654 RepID=UPI003BA2C906